jgi:DNA modification methylase
MPLRIWKRILKIQSSKMEGLLDKVANTDCFELFKKLPDNSIDLVVTDPPYNLAYNGRGKINSFEVFAGDKMLEGDYAKFMSDVFAECFRVLKDDTAIYCFIDYRKYPLFYSLLSKDFDIKNCLVMDKGSIGMGQHYRFQHEFCIYAIKGKHKLRLEKKNVSDVWKFKRQCGSTSIHPTQKDVEVLKKMIQYSSDERNIVLDPFCGSCSTLVAAKEMNRHFIGSEIDADYVSKGQARLGLT